MSQLSKRHDDGSDDIDGNDANFIHGKSCVANCCSPDSDDIDDDHQNQNQRQQRSKAKDECKKEQQREEVGYVFLEECEVVVVLSSDDAAGVDDAGVDDGRQPLYKSSCSTSSSARIELSKRSKLSTVNTLPAWHTVNLQYSPNHNNSVVASEEGRKSNEYSDRCDLILRPCYYDVSMNDAKSLPSSDDKERITSWRSAIQIHPFHGMLSEININNTTTIDDHNSNTTTKASNSTTQTNNFHSSRDDDNVITSNDKWRRRSDASLLAGLAISINQLADDESLDGGDMHNNIEPHLSQLRMNKGKIMFWDSIVVEDSQFVDNEMRDDVNNDAPKNGGKSSRTHTRVKASLLLTFSLPINNANQHEKKKSSTTTKVAGKCKMLSSAHQLLGSIIRCDWNYLHTTMKTLECEAARNAVVKDRSWATKPFFPNSLNVEELYDRISGASQHFFGRERKELRETIDGTTNLKSSNSQRSTSSNPAATKQGSLHLSEKENDRTRVDTNNLKKSNRSKQSTSSHCSIITEQPEFLTLPEDVMATSIAPYLRAKSLRSLRMSHRKLRRSLRTVIPGLKLKLFHHQIRSLEWMEMRERRCITEGDLLTMTRNNNDEGEAAAASASACGGDYHRAVTGGATVCLAPRLNDGCDDDDNDDDDDSGGSLPLGVGGAMRFDSESGSLMTTEESSCDNNSARKTTRCARGGLLCDDPGLGKTITVISLILRTFGLSTEAAVAKSSTSQDEDDDDSLFHPYWKSSFLTEHVRTPALLQLIRKLINSDADSEWFIPPIREYYLDQCPDYLDVISTPICLQEVREKYNKGDASNDFEAFERDVKLCFENAMEYNPPEHVVHKAAIRLSTNFDTMVMDFKRRQIEVASKSISRMKNDPTARSLVDLLEARKRAKLEEPLVFSSSTLLVVPNPLLQHWEDQMLLHIDFSYITSSSGGGDDDYYSPPIYYHTSKRKSKPSGNNITFELSDVGKPLIFIDDGSRALPSAAVLARFPVVLTSYNRFTADWKNGSIEQEFRASKRGKGTYWGDDAPEASSLLKVSWLRVIVDEGHVMGKNTNNLIQFASWLTAQRRWAMTGTPTQQIATQNGLKNLYFLANFLNHEYFNRQLGREKVWNSLISQGWKDGYLFAFFRLRHLMSYLMVRHTKQDLVEIPPPVFKVSDICLSQAEATTYNTIVSGIRTNIITTSMEGKTSGWQDSLLNPRQSKFASEALRNLRVSCCGGLQILPHILNKHWSETLEMLRDIHHLDEVGVQVVNNFIHRAQTAELSSCHSCGIQLQTLFVIPCGHLVCTECIDSKTELCPVCKQTFDVDDFQRLQPGLNFQFSLNIQEEKKERDKQNALMRVLAGSTRPGVDADIDELEDLEVDSEHAHRPTRSHRRGESCVYSPRHLDGKCTICREEHFDCNFMANNGQCSVCHKFAEECPPYASKSKYVIDRLLQLRDNDLVNGGSRRCNVSPTAARLFAMRGNKERTHRPLKAIIFSQFRTIYEYFGDRLIRRFGGACVADYSYAKTRAEELQKFIHHPECFAMLLSKEGSVGLDLSFVTHIFFLDSIYDKSLESQVVARAYRMGATGPVYVDELMAKDSVEEVMIQMNGNRQAKSQASKDNKEKHAKLHLLLKSAKLIRSQKEHKMRKRKIMENDEVQTTNDQQKQDTKNSKQKIKTAGVRFKD